ncbi:MAG: DNA translocase FtsK [Rhodospirillales bacterium]|nr:MAG: DNA translocase FtsK [Rhodospirillales bacterium]
MASRRRTAVLPAGLGAFVRRRLVEGVGLALIATAIVVIVAMLTYDSSDPSLNTAGGRGSVNNLLGYPGAVVADLALQTLGLTAGLGAIIVGAWGYLLFRRGGLRQVWARFAVLSLVLLTGAVTFEAMPEPESWPLRAGLGGLVGRQILIWLTAAAGGTGPLSDPFIVGTMSGIATACATLWLLGFSRAEWRAGWARISALLAAPRRAVSRARSAARRGPAANEADAVRAEPYLAAAQDPFPTGEPPAAPTARAKRRLEPRKRTPRPLGASQASLDLAAPDGTFQPPPLDLLEAVPQADARDAELSPDSLEQNARLLEQVLEDFGIRGEIVKVRPGPVVTLYELEPAPGIKTSRVIGLADDIARSMSAISARIATIPGRNVIGIELPNAHRQTVFLRELLAAPAVAKSALKLPLALGKDIGGAPVVVDLARMPHLLVAGTTGSGKSVGLNAMVLSLLFRLTPDECKFIMIDPKMLELSVYDDIPHLIAPVVTEPKKAVVALKWTVREMEERYRSMSKLGVRNIEGYNARLAKARRSGEVLTRKVQTGFDSETGRPVYEDQPLDLSSLPYIVVVVDEMADLMMVAGKEIEAAIQRLSQMARAAGIHLIMATQRPSVDVVTGTIKANFPTRVSFQVTSRVDSRTILGEQGAEQLLGRGDMLYMAGGGRITRIHGPFIDETEVEAVAAFLRDQGAPIYNEGVTEEEEGPGEEALGGGDEMYHQAVELVVREGRASTSFIQRHLQIGYNRAARIIEQMEKQGVVSPANHVGKREILGGGSGHGH